MSVEKVHLPRPGVRRAVTCPVRECTWREFLAVGVPVPKCPTHGQSVMQENRSYRGQSTR